MLGYIIALVILIISLIGELCRYFPYPHILPVVGGNDTQLVESKQLAVYNKYKDLRAPKKMPTFDEFCYPKSYSVQRQQKFAGEYMRPGMHHDSLLVFHKPGAGKTCLAIQVAEPWTSHGRPLVLMPASLIPGFRNELRSRCAGYKYITREDYDELHEHSPTSSAYKAIISRSDDLIDRIYNILSYNKFAELMAKCVKKMDKLVKKSQSTGEAIPKSALRELRSLIESLDAPILIIDEVQNIDSSLGAFYKSALTWTELFDGPVILMTGTPIFDRPSELTNIARLMRIISRSNNQYDDAIIPVQNIPKLFAGRVSYFAGAPEYTFPETFIKVKKCVMSKFQVRWYRSEVSAEMSKHGKKLVPINNDFYIKSRQRSNIVCPNGLTGEDGMRALTQAIIRDSLDVYSCKYAACIKKLRRGGLAFIYTCFTGVGGISSLIKCLEAHGWVNFAIEGPGRRRYAIWSGEQTLREKDIVRITFNEPENDDASQLQIIIGSPAIKEGVSLFRVRHVHILEAYWNHSRLEQIYSRAVRFCSHRRLPKAERNVIIYIYCAVTRSGLKIENVTPLESIDLYMLNIADKKRDEAEPYIAALMNVAVDKYLHYGKPK